MTDEKQYGQQNIQIAVLCVGLCGLFTQVMCKFFSTCIKGYINNVTLYLYKDRNVHENCIIRLDFH